MPRRLLLLAGGLVIAIFLLQAYRMKNQVPASGASVTLQATEGVPQTVLPETTDQKATTTKGGPVAAKIDLNTTGLRDLLVAKIPYPHEVPMDLYQGQVWAEISWMPPDLATRGDPAVDGDLAFRLYAYYRLCSGAPRTLRQADFRLQSVDEKIGSDSSLNRLESLAERLDQQFDLYQLCLPIGPDVDALFEAVKWFGYAVERGHEVAQVQYYYSAMETMLFYRRGNSTPSLVMIHPELIDEYKYTARKGLNAALKLRHPDAYLAMSIALGDGIIYPRDPVAAYAYALAAEQQSGPNSRYADRVKEINYTNAQLITQEQIWDAEKMARELISRN